MHLGQLITQKGFVQMEENPCFAFCGTATVMPLNNVTLPTALINGAEDPLADTTDVNWLATQL